MKGKLMVLKKHGFSSTKLFYGHEKRFFNQVEVGGTYRYYYGHYMFDDVKKAAAKNGVIISYNISGSTQYYKYGPYNFTVVSMPKQEPVKTFEPQLFDINELAI
jgi:outer membrane cobalamin receptor